MLGALIRTIRGLFVVLLSLWKRLMCRSIRNRKNSGSLLPVHLPKQNLAPATTEELQSWDSWGDDDIAVGRTGQENTSRKSSEIEEEEPVDYFQDMVPQYKKAAKIKVVTKSSNYAPSARLNMVDGATYSQGNGLEAWDETEGSWGQELDEDVTSQADSAIRESRRIEREQRRIDQERKRAEKEAARTNRTAPFRSIKLS